MKADEQGAARAALLKEVLDQYTAEIERLPFTKKQKGLLRDGFTDGAGGILRELARRGWLCMSTADGPITYTVDERTRSEGLCGVFFNPVTVCTLPLGHAGEHDDARNVRAK